MPVRAYVTDISNEDERTVELLVGPRTVAVNVGQPEDSRAAVVLPAGPERENDPAHACGA